MFSKACENGIRAVLLIAVNSLKNERIGLKKIAAEIEAPEAFTAKILQNLVKQNILHSTKGPNGGFYIEREEIDTIKLIQIVETIDGDKFFSGCGLGLKKCDAKPPCPVHNELMGIRENLKDMLEKTSIYQLAKGINSGLTFLKH
jgi:Rrf2 family protein